MSTQLSHCLRSRSYTFSTDRCRTDQRIRDTLSQCPSICGKKTVFESCAGFFCHRKIHLLGFFCGTFSTMNPIFEKTKLVRLVRVYSKMNECLGGGFKYVLFSPLFGEDFQFDEYFSKGLKPPTRCALFHLSVSFQGMV